MSTPSERHVGYVTSNDTTPLVEGAAKAVEAMGLMSGSVDQASAATKRAAAQVVTSSDEIVRAKAQERLAYLTVIDAMNDQARQAGLLAKAQADTAASTELLQAEITSQVEGAARVVAAQQEEIDSTERLRAAVTASLADMDAQVALNAKAWEDSAAKVSAAQKAQSGESALGGVKAAGAASALALGVIGVESLKSAVSFQQSTELFKTQAGQTQAQVELLRQGILDLSSSVATGPNALAGAMYAVVSAGYANAGALNIQKEAALGAKVGNADLVQTTDALASTMKALNAPASSAGAVMGQLNAIVGSGKLTMDQLNAALATGVVPTVASAGVSLQSLGAALSYMTDRGIPADQAAQKLRQTVALIASPSGEAAKALGAIGLQGPAIQAATEAMATGLRDAHVSTTQLTDDLKKPDGIQVAVQDLYKHLVQAGVGADAAGAILGKAFGGGRSDAAILELIGNLTGVKQKFDQIGKTASDFGDDVTATTKTAAYQYDQLKASTEKLGVELGTKLLPIANDVLTFFNHGNPAAIALGIGIGLLTVATVAWTVALLANPVGAITAGVIALSVGIYEAYQHSETFRNFANAAFRDVATAAGYMAAGVVLAVRTLGDAMLTAFSAITHGAAGIADALHLPFRHGLDAARDDLDSFHSSFDSSLTSIGNDAASLGARAGSLFGSNFKAAAASAQSSAREDDNVKRDQAKARAAGNATPTGGSGTDLGGALADLGGGSGGYTAPAATAAAPKAAKALTATQQAVSDLRDQEKQLAVSIALAVAGSQDQRDAALQSAASTLSQAQALEVATRHTKDHTGAVSALATAQRDYARISTAVDKSGLTRVEASQAAVATRVQQAPTGAGVAGASATLAYDQQTQKAAAGALAQAEAYAKAKHNAADHARALKDVAAAQTAVDNAQKAALAAQDALNAAVLQARQDAVDLANAQGQMSVVGASASVQAQEKLAEAQRQVGVDVQGTTKWYQDQAAVLQDQIDLQTALAQAVTDAAAAQQKAQQDAVDLANAQQEAALTPGDDRAAKQAAVDEAQRQLSIDVQGTLQYYEDQKKLNDATFALTQQTTTAAAAMSDLTSSLSSTTTVLPSYLADVLQANSGAYASQGSTSTTNAPVVINIDGQQVASSSDGRDLVSAINGYLRSNGKPLIGA